MMALINIDWNDDLGGKNGNTTYPGNHDLGVCYEPKTPSPNTPTYVEKGSEGVCCAGPGDTESCEPGLVCLCGDGGATMRNPLFSSMPEPETADGCKCALA